MSIGGYQIEIDTIDRPDWNHVITQFHDATLSQVWLTYDSAEKKRNLSHVVMKVGDEILGCCQVELRSVPLFGTGLADVRWGPLYMKKGIEPDRDVLFHLIRAIKYEYAKRRRYMIRIWPHVKGDDKMGLKQMLETEGFVYNLGERPYRTLMLDLSPSTEDLRKNFLQKWRNCLNKAEKSGIVVVSGTSDDLYGTFSELARRMVARKDLGKVHFKAFEEYRNVQKALPEQFKMQIMIGKVEDEPVCAAVCSAIGNTGIYVFGATAEKGLAVNGSYLLQWHMIKWMKERGVTYYDLGAFNPQRNPGVYHFKLGVSGKAGWEETFIGEYHGCFSLRGRMVKAILDFRSYIGRVNESRNSNRKK